MPKATDTIIPRDGAEALIDLRMRYGRCVRMVWTLLGVIVMLASALAFAAWQAATVTGTVDRLSDDLEAQRIISEAQETQRRTDRAEQRYALCQRPAEMRPAEPLCDGYETLDAAYASEGVKP